MSRRASPPKASQADIEDTIDVLRQNLDRADAMVSATEYQLERFTWGDGSDDEDEDAENNRGRRLNHLSHLLGAAKEAVLAAVYAGSEVAAELARRQKGS